MWRFAKDVKKGDRIIANLGFSKVLGVGEVTGNYFYVDEEYGHRIPVTWYDTAPRDIYQPGWRVTLVQLDRSTFDQIVQSKAAGNAVTMKPQHADNPLLKLLLQRMNIVFYGPPGTGKTRESLQIAKKWRDLNGHDSVLQVTFHPSFAYEDFIEGFRPDESGKFVRRDGVFLQACQLAHANSSRKFLLVIDELNRGDVARLFGELITLIEADKRHAAVSRKLPYSGQDLWVPPNLYLLGTMNTADRSISLLDVAIRRRFCFVEFGPDADVIRQSEHHHRDVLGIDLGELLNALNIRLQNAGIDRDRAIGHSHFLVPIDADDPAELLIQKFKFDIIPLVEEYCYANRSLICQIFGSLVDTTGKADLTVFKDTKRFAMAVRSILNTVSGEEITAEGGQPK